MKRILLLYFCLISFSSCYDDIIITESMNVDTTTRAMDTDYYWGSTGKIPLTRSSNNSYLLLKADGGKLKKSLQSSQITDIRDYSLQSTIDMKKSYLSANLKEGIGKISDMSSLIKNDEIVYAAPYFVFEDGKEFPLTNVFYVELKSPENVTQLEKLAENNRVDVVGRIPLTEDAYILSCTKNSTGNALQMANLFYETGLFLSSTPEFLSIESYNVDDPYFVQQWNLNNTGQYGGTSGIDINLINARKITSGSDNITIAVIDGGMPTNHPDLNVGYVHDVVSRTDNSVIYSNHGIACGGIIGARANNGTGVAGIAPDCNLMSISTPLITASLVYALIYAAQNGADVISNSWGGSVEQPTLNSAIKYAMQNGRNGKGCVVVFAAGNDNRSSVGYPANSDPDILAVGAISMNGQRKSPTSFDGETVWGSNYGSALDVMAPGVLIPTTDLIGTAGYNPNDRIHPNNGGRMLLTDYSDQNYTVWFNGTSSACPQVAGIAGLILSLYPNLYQSEVTNIIEKSTRKVRSDLYSYSTKSGRSNGIWHEQMGYGLVDAYKSLTSRLEISGPSKVLSGAEAIFKIETPPRGVVVSGHNITPSGYYITSGGYDRTEISIRFYNAVTYTLNIIYSLPNGGTHTVSKSIEVVGIPYILAEEWMDFAKFQANSITGLTNYSYEWEVNLNGRIITKEGGHTLLVNRAGTVFTGDNSNPVQPPSGYYNDLTVQARCRIIHNGSKSDWSDMKSVTLRGGNWVK